MRWLVAKAGFHERKPQDLNQLIVAERGLVCQFAWQSWENLLWTLARGTDEELSKFVRDP
eukprot:4313865-Lingulodinium_polyedra.AAC.1